ncbi:GAF and ANTAR domain-containing protein [Cryobacterium sp. M15]|uniref:GAF and ANTAR domain-containing protein n=1 Tax=Cryobacterium sp. M15 TaxID=2048291 RepID=UPI003513A9F7
MMIGERGRRTWQISPAIFGGMNAISAADTVAERVAQRGRERLAGITTQSGWLIVPLTVTTSLKVRTSLTNSRIVTGRKTPSSQNTEIRAELVTNCGKESRMIRMTNLSRASLVSGAFVQLADALVGEYDSADLLRTLVDQCVVLLDATAAGLLLADQQGNLQVIASTSEESRRVEVLQHEAGAGPCVDAYHSGTVVTLSDIATDGNDYPVFQAAALAQGFQSVHAIPMRFRPNTIGALNLFRSHKGALSDEDAVIGQALADVATITLLHERTARKNATVNAQLQHALNSRVFIEQAKGVIAARNNINMDEAFKRLRAHARSRQEPMHRSAADVINNLILI